MKVKCYLDRDGDLWIDLATDRYVCVEPELSLVGRTLDEVAMYGPLKEIMLSDEPVPADPTSEASRLEDELERVKYDRDCLRCVIETLTYALRHAAASALVQADDWTDSDATVPAPRREARR